MAGSFNLDNKLELRVNPARGLFALISRLGSFWSSEMRDEPFLAAYGRALSFLWQQMDTDFDESISVLAVDDCNVGHTEHWMTHTIYESQLQSAPWLFGDENLAFGDGKASFGLGRTLYRVPLPTGIRAFPCLSYKTEGAPVWTQGVDYYFKDGHLYFAHDPFSEWPEAVVDVFTDGHVSDRSIKLVMQEVDVVSDNLNTHWGSVIQATLDDLRSDKRLAIATVDSLTLGLSLSLLEVILSTAAGLPVTGHEEEILEAIVPDGEYKLAITDKAVHRVRAVCTIPWEVGKAIPPNRAICDAVRIYEGSADQLRDLEAVAVRYRDGGDIVFANKEFPPTTVNGVVIPRVVGTDSSVRLFSKTAVASGILFSDASNPMRWLLNNIGRYMVVVRLIPDWFLNPAGAYRAASLIRKVLPSHLKLTMNIDRRFDEKSSIAALDTPEIGVASQQIDRHSVGYLEKVMLSSVKDN